MNDTQSHALTAREPQTHTSSSKLKSNQIDLALTECKRDNLNRSLDDISQDD